MTLTYLFQFFTTICEFYPVKIEASHNDTFNSIEPRSIMDNSTRSSPGVPGSLLKKHLASLKEEDPGTEFSGLYAFAATLKQACNRTRLYSRFTLGPIVNATGPILQYVALTDTTIIMAGRRAGSVDVLGTSLWVRITDDIVSC